MVDDVFLNGAVAKAQPETAKPAEVPQKVAAPAPVSEPRMAPSNDSVNAPIASFSRHKWAAGRWCSRSPIPTLGISWRIGETGRFRETDYRHARSRGPRKRMPQSFDRTRRRRAAGNIQVRYVDASGELQGPYPIRFEPEAGSDPRTAQKSST
jgi:hypothetical protein